MNDQQDRTTHSAKVAHHISGRVRVRLRHSQHRSHVLRTIKSTLATHSGIHNIEVNEVAGSVAVTYDPTAHTLTGILGLLEDLNVTVGMLMDVPRIENPMTGSGHSETALTLAEALDDLNRRLATVTGNMIDLRVLFPLGLVGLGLWQISKQGLMLDMLPGWVLVWLGFDAFLKLHTPHSAVHDAESAR